VPKTAPIRVAATYMAEHLNITDNPFNKYSVSRGKVIYATRVILLPLMTAVDRIINKFVRNPAQPTAHYGQCGKIENVEQFVTCLILFAQN